MYNQSGEALEEVTWKPLDASSLEGFKARLDLVGIVSLGQGHFSLGQVVGECCLTSVHRI